MPAQQNPISEALTPRRALYLLSPNPHTIQSDTTRLLIHPHQQLPRPYPLNRINRIVSGPAAQWHGNAIAACLSRDIPIIWLDSRNQPVGDSHPLHTQGGSLHHALQTYIDLPDWQTRYTHWLKNRRMDILQHIHQQRLHTQKEYETLLRQYVYQNRLPTQPHPAIHAACASYVNQHLASLHTRTRYWGYSGQPLEIASDLTQLLISEHHLSHPNPPRDTQQNIQQLENHWKELTPRFHHHLNQLHQHLQSENDSWQ